MLASGFEIAEYNHHTFAGSIILFVHFTVAFNLRVEIFYVVCFWSYFKLADPGYILPIFPENDVTATCTHTHLPSPNNNIIAEYYFVFDCPELTEQKRQATLVV